MRLAAWAVVLAAVLSACTRDAGPGTFVEFAKRTPPAVPSRTAAIDPSWVEPGGTIGTTIADGQYWGTIDGVGEGFEGRFVSLLLTQAFFATACVEQFDEAACADDYEAIDPPAGSFPAFVVDLTEVSVVTPDRQNYSVSAAQFAELLLGGDAAAAPPDFEFELTYPVLLTVAAGRVTELNQIWVP